jgi:hydrogenase expression/formation protein HypC
MCLSIPARIDSIEDDKAIVTFSSTQLHISLQLTENAKVGDYVLVHAGYAIQIIDAEEAQNTLDLLKELDSM